MSDYMIVPGRGKVRKSSSIGCMISYSNGSGSSTREPRESIYERTKREVYATGNKWAIENFHATHD
jgi:hypothetical protein